MKIAVLIFLAMPLASSAQSIHGDSLSTIVEMSRSCFERETHAFASQNLDGSMIFTSETKETFIGSDSGGYSLFLTTKMQDRSNGCGLEFILTEHGLSVSVNNKCAISNKFLYFYLANDGRDACLPPSVQMNMKTVNDGYDRFGQPINERREFVSARVQRGDCTKKTKLFLRNFLTKKPTELTLDAHRLLSCFSESVKQ